MRKVLARGLLGALLCIAAPVAAATQPVFPPCGPRSEILVDDATQVDVAFCANWNPEFPFNGNHCCTKVIRKRRGNRCFQERRKAHFCDDITEEQKEYAEAVESGRIPDVLAFLQDGVARRSTQAYCGVNNGYLAYGRRVIASEQNRIAIRSPQRCTNFGTDGMAGLLEWLGRQVKQKYSDPEYSQVRLVVGDISAPRGGCLSGPSGRKGHASHTSGQDADVSFLSAKPGRASPVTFHRDFDPRVNWWLLKNIFKNPYACVKVVFLDRHHIGKLAKVARGDEDWEKYRRFVRHIRGHRNHFHVRVGDFPGLPGCAPDAHPELEDEDTGDDSELETPENETVPDPGSAVDQAVSPATSDAPG